MASADLGPTRRARCFIVRERYRAGGTVDPALTGAARLGAAYDRTVLLSDGTIRAMLEDGSLALDPIDDEQIQPSSVDVRLDRVLRVFRNHTAVCIDPMEPTETLTEPVSVG